MEIHYMYFKEHSKRSLPVKGVRNRVISSGRGLLYGFYVLLLITFFRQSSFAQVTFSPWQQIPTVGAMDWEFFTIGSDAYLAVANRENGSTYNINSKIYRWNGTSFNEIQSILTHSAWDWEFFSIGSDSYLMVSNEYNSSGGTSNAYSVIYRWNGTAFVHFHSIATEQAHDCEVFTIGSDTYLSVTNYKLGSDYSRYSKIYRWNGVTFIEVQNIFTYGAVDWEAFTIGSDSYLAVANHYTGNSYNTDSKIYRWDGSNFTHVQDIPTHGALDWEAFTIGSDVYLAVANYRTASSFNIDSKIYRWNGTAFVEVQSIATHGAHGWESFTIGSDSYLAVANQYDGSSRYIESKIYRWNGTSFIEAQSIGTTSAADWEFFTICSESYLAVANRYNGSSYYVNSTIYKINGTGTPCINSCDNSLWTLVDSSSSIYRDTGRVGIGLSKPGEKLSVAGVIESTTGGIKFPDGSIQTTAALDTSASNELQVLSVNGNQLSISGGNTVTLPGGSSKWEENGTSLYYNAGHVGIGTSTPAAALNVNGNLMLNNGNFMLDNNRYITVTRSDDGFAQQVFSMDANNDVMLNRSAIVHGKVSRTVIGFNGRSFDVRNQHNQTLLRVMPDGKVGIGTVSPLKELHVQGGAKITELGGAGTRMVVADPNGVLSTQPLPNASLWIPANSGVSYTSGNVGVGTVSPAYALDVNGACRINTQWVVSDGRYKKNIRPLGDVIEKLSALKGVSYQYRNEEFEGKKFMEGTNYGFIAQELKEVFPDLVSEDAAGFYAINYDALIPLLTEAVKEQQEELHVKGTQINELETRLDELEVLLLNICNNGCEGLSGQKAFGVNSNSGRSHSTDLPKAVLFQNEPNPFREKTVIRYEVPTDARNTSIVIHNLQGERLERFDNLAGGTGSIEVDGRKLGAGTYLYSLLTDGKETDTKRMVLTK